MKTQGFDRSQVPLLELQQAILLAQIEHEQELSVPGRVLLSDRSALDPIVYAVLTAPSAEEAQQRKESLLKQPQIPGTLDRYKTALFVLLEPIEDWRVEDGVRVMDRPQECLAIYKQLLAELGIAYRVIGNDTRRLEDRVAWVLSTAGR